MPSPSSAPAPSRASPDSWTSWLRAATGSSRATSMATSWPTSPFRWRARARWSRGTLRS